LGVQLLRHGADIGQAVSLASLRERGGMCGRQCRVGARNGGHDAVVGRGGNTAEGQLGRLSGCEQRCRRRMRGHVRAGWTARRVSRQRVRRAGGPRSDDMWTGRDEPRVHRDNRASEGMTYFLRRAKAHFTSPHADTGGCTLEWSLFTAAGCQLLFLRTAHAHGRLHRQTRVRCGPAPWMCLLQKARCVRAGTTTTRQLHPILDHRWTHWATLRRLFDP
jgi:hypothetical protein